jgi:hypothetical protein
MTKTHPVSNDFHNKSFEYYNDFTKISVSGKWYHLGFIQAKIIKQLYIASFTNSPWICGKTLLYNAGSESQRLRDLFKSQNYWQELIISDYKGNYRLRVCSK